MNRVVRQNGRTGRRKAIFGRLALGFCLLAAATETARAGDWPQWGGTDARNMISDETGLPADFDPGQTARLNPPNSVAHRPLASGATSQSAAGSGVIPLDPAARNLRWTARLGSQTLGSPTVAGGRICIGTNNAFPRNPKYAGDRGVLLCLDERTGGLLWQLILPKYTRTPGMKLFDLDGLGITSPATFDDGRVYLVSNRAEMLCLKAAGMDADNAGAFRDEAALFALPGRPPVALDATDADILWRFDMITELHIRPHEASNCAVLVHGDCLYVCTSNGINDSHKQVEAPNAPSLIVLDKRSGKLLAVDDAGVGPRILHGQWSSPSLGTVGGRTLVFWGGGDGLQLKRFCADVK